MKKRYKLIALMLFCTTTAAGINEDLNKFFQDLNSGSGANVTQAAAWQGQEPVISRVGRCFYATLSGKSSLSRSPCPMLKPAVAALMPIWGHLVLLTPTR